MAWLAVLIGAYLLGSIPFGYLIAKSKGVDIRSVGSGNIGATNVIRAVGKTAGIVVFLLDVSKGLIPSLVAHHLIQRPEWLGSQQEFAFIAGLTAVLGHCLSPFLGFKGGKGVATALGAMFGASPLVALTVFAIFLLSLAISRYVSLSSLIAACALPLFGWLYEDPPTLIGAYIVLAVLLFLRHRSNIKRLMDGTESKFTFGSKRPNEKPPEDDASKEGDNP
jgi:acyl phosphate:glycerol-3-phosphate acyltransferase